MRVNRRTETAGKAEPEQAGVAEELTKLSIYQKRLQGMTEEMVRRLQGLPPSE